MQIWAVHDENYNWEFVQVLAIPGACEIYDDLWPSHVTVTYHSRMSHTSSFVFYVLQAGRCAGTWDSFKQDNFRICVHAFFYKIAQCKVCTVFLN